MSAGPLQISPALLGSPIGLPVYLKAVSAGLRHLPTTIPAHRQTCRGC